MSSVPPLVSVIIPAYNAARFIADTLNSVVAQTITRIEVIVVDDGSKDDTAKIVERFRPAVQLIRQENQGVAAARNTGIASARGQFIAFLDADDTWLPEKLSRQLECYEREPSLGCVGCDFFVTDEKLNILSKAISTLEGLSGLLLMTTNSGLNGSTFLIPSRVLADIGGFDRELSTSADWDLATRIATAYRVDSVRECLMCYRQHGNAMHRGISLMERDMCRVLTKAFSSALPPQLARLRRRSFSNMYRTLAGSYYHVRDRRNAIRCGLRSLACRPTQLFNLIAPIFYLRTRSGPGI